MNSTKTCLFSRIDLRSLMFVMKFVYHFHDMKDIEELYHLTKTASINLPMKRLEVVKNQTLLPNPLAITDYLANIDPKKDLHLQPKPRSWNININDYGRRNFEYIKSTEFRPALTDMGVCQSYNSRYEKDVFVENSVGQFHEVFHRSVDTSGIKMEKGSRKELTFILDAQENRRNYPFVPKGSTYFAG